MFSAYLWGIETILPEGPRRGPNIVFSVPMRNWNLCRYTSGERGWRVFSVPMRNWNHFSRNLLITSLLVFSVPMRNWNPNHGVTIQYSYISVFSVPMRNWNTINDTLFEVSVCSFQRTYEELKQKRKRPLKRPQSLFSAYLWGIETWRKHPAPPGVRYRFQRTYEELKQPFRRLGRFRLLVFSVPMRNWNRILNILCNT